MGRQLPPGYLTRHEVAKELNITLNTVDALSRQGALAPKLLKGIRGRVFRRDEVREARAKLEGRTDLHTLKAQVLAALSTARRCEERLSEVYDRLGFDIDPLDRTESAVLSLYREVQHEPALSDVRFPGWLRRWRGVFFSIDEHYLELVEHLTGNKEPWAPYLRFANAVARLIHEEQEDALTFAARPFFSSLEHLTHVSYMYCRHRHGVSIANVVFDGRKTAVEELLAILT